MSPTMMSTGAVAADGMARKSGEKNKAAAKHMAVVNADSPLRPPCATPAALSMNTQAAEVPNMPDDIVAEESAMNTLFILGMLPSLSA